MSSQRYGCWLSMVLAGSLSLGVYPAVAIAPSGSSLGGNPRSVLPQDRNLSLPTQVTYPSPPAQPQATYLSPLEQAVLDEMNFARQNPAAYAEILVEQRQYYNGNRLERPGQVTILTAEGVAAVDEAIAYLRNATPQPPLAPSYGMHLAAKDHVNDIGSSGVVSHTGSDGSNVSDRLNRYGRWLERAGENIDFGSHEARDVLISLIVDDGVPNRGHRTNIFNGSFLMAGVACGEHAYYKTMRVIDYAAGYEEAFTPPVATTTLD